MVKKGIICIDGDITTYYLNTDTVEIPRLSIREGAKEELARLSENYGIILTTNAPREHVSQILSASGLGRSFDAVADSDSGLVRGGPYKPRKDYVAVAERFGISAVDAPGKVIAVGDNEYDLPSRGEIVTVIDSSSMGHRYSAVSSVIGDLGAGGDFRAGFESAYSSGEDVSEGVREVAFSGGVVARLSYSDNGNGDMIPLVKIFRAPEGKNTRIEIPTYRKPEKSAG